MGLLGGGDDSLSASSGWGMMPPMNSSSDWGSSSNTGVGGGGGNATSSSGVITNHWQASSNTSSNGSASAGGGSSQNSTNSNSVNVAGRQNALSNHNSANDQLLSSSPKPSSSWAQAAGKGLVNATASTSGSSSTNGPIINSSSSNSHDQPLSSYSNATATMAGNSQQSSASSSSSQGPTNANLNGGPVGMSANSSNNASSNNPNSSSSAFQSSSNSNTSTGGLIGGSSSNPIDAAVVNKQRSGPSGSSGGISDLIGQLSDDFRETLLTEKWGSTVINQDSSWNLPPSPQSSPKDTSTWRCPVNSGTEIWENAVRHKKGSVGGSSAASLSSSVTLSSAQPWSHTPTTHIGGTWGEEEDSSNHWTGVPQSSSLNSVSGGNGNGGGLSGGFGGAGPSGLSALGGVNSSSINNNWSAGSGMSNGTGSGISGYPLLNNSGGIGLGSNSISGLGPDNNNSGGNSWNNGCNDKSAFESRSKGPNWNNFGDQVDSSSEPNWDKSMGGGNDFGTWPDKKDAPSWDRDSNDSQKGGVDDGTACWGNPRGVVNPSRTVPSWKDNKFGGNNNKNGFNNGWNANGGNGNGNKSSNQSQMLNRTWTDASGHRKSPSLWNDDTKSLNGNMTPNNMSDGQIDTSSWFNSKPTKPLTREMILSSKQFRLLVDLGFKKDDVENTLRNYQMRFDDALMDLEQNKSFKSTSALGVNPNINKMQQSNRNQFLGGGGNGSSAMLNAQSMANNNSLQNLVQRIQLAVSTGFLNPQILNQPLSNQNLEIISELLHQIKLLKEVQMSATLPNLNAGAKSQLETKSFHIKQNISMLQNQLRSEQPGQGQGGKVGLQSNDFFKSNNDLYGGLNEYGAATGGGSQGSRLHSWKQSSYNKQQSNEDKLNALGAEFSRAPGGLSKQSSTSSNWGNNFMGGSDDGGWPADLGQLTKPHEDDYFGQQDFDSYKSTWKSTAKGMMDDDPRSPISQNAIVKESMFSWTSGSAPKTNSLLSGNGNGGGQNQMDSLNSSFGFGGGSSNPWSYNSNGASQSANSQMFTDLNKKPTVNKSTWGNQGLNSEYPDSLWNTGANSGAAGGSSGNGGAGSGAAGKPRPPPGLSQVKNSNSSNSNSIWNSGLSSSNTNSEYLRLRNLTPQIDGSTLKTLCCQHGPLLLFHLFLNHGTAIARYQARDQAIKAQSALNNCVLGNTTILADLPAESEVQQYLQLINGGGHSSNISGGQQSSNGSNGGGVHGGSSGHHSHQSQQQQSQSAQSSQQQAQSHHQHHAAHHSQPYNSSWSNGTNASQSTAGAGAAGSAGAQSTNQQSQHNSLYSRANSVSGGQNSASAAAAHLSPFGTAPAAINSFSSLQSTSSPASTLPYGAGGAGAPGLVTTHSSSLPYHNVLNQASAASAAVAAASQFNKMDNGLLSSWNTGTGSNNLWDSSSLGGPVGGAAGLWSSAGFSAADRNTPIQNFLPGDLLAGENN